jgi:hypothetical protein
MERIRKIGLIILTITYITLVCIFWYGSKANYEEVTEVINKTDLKYSEAKELVDASHFLTTGKYQRIEVEIVRYTRGFFPFYYNREVIKKYPTKIELKSF